MAFGTFREQTSHVDLTRHRNNGQLIDEYERLMDKANQLIAERLPEITKFSLSKYAYETIKHGNAIYSGGLNEFDMMLGIPIEVDKSQTERIKML